MMGKQWSRLLVMVLAVALCSGAWAGVSVPSIFGDHMVLQQGKTIPVWGKAAPGEAVIVKLGGKTAKAVADDKGNWKATLGRLSAGTGAVEMTISGKDSTVTIHDVLVGEVWVGSGQSNMEWPLKAARDGDAEVAAAKYPEIRLFTVKKAVSVTPKDNCEGAWMVCSPETAPMFSAVLYFFGRELHQQLKTPVGLINTSWGGTPAESWTSRATLEADPDLKVIVERGDKQLADYPAAKATFEKAMAEWQKAADKAKAENQPAPKGQPQPPIGPEHPWTPSGLYNAMIMPIVPYAIKGSIWYQGESNAGRAYQYRKLFPTMIQDWRRTWNEGAFPFYFVQLANFIDKGDKSDCAWAELREAQTMTLKLKNTGMAVITDIGDPNDIHPKNKQDVGKRLALNALAKDYHKHVIFSGPMYKKMKVEGGKVVVSFTHTDGGLLAKGGALKGFAVAGSDGTFTPADAVIEGNTVVVSSPKVTAPVAVRYAWASNPENNLYNGAGLPASSFRTDDWPGVTKDNK